MNQLPLILILIGIVVFLLFLDLLHRTWYDRCEIEIYVESDPSKMYLLHKVPFMRHLWQLVLRKDPMILYHPTIRPYPQG